MEQHFMQQEITNAEVRKDIEFIKENLREINVKLDQKYVTHDEFEPVKRLVFGLVAAVLLSVTGSLMVLILK
jgi:hypothetical protein